MANVMFFSFLTQSICRQKIPKSIVSSFYRCTSHFANLNLIKENDDETKEVLKKLLYNDVLWKKLMDRQKEMRMLEKEKSKTIPKAICLQYLVDDQSEKNSKKDTEAKDSDLKNEISDSNHCHFPYEISKSYLIEDVQLDEEIKCAIPEDVAHLTPVDQEKARPPNQWNSHKVDDVNFRFDVADVIRYGTCNPSLPISDVPCGGCGAFLHCIDEGMPGFLPQEIFCNTKQKNLKSELCQRCFFLKEFNIGLGVNVSPKEYPKLLSEIKNKTALVVLMIDILDFPCCIWPGIGDIIGSNPVVIVANKVDLLICENSNFEKSMKETIINSLLENDINAENVLEILLTSAKKGFGVERLINCINNKWDLQGDVYLMGSTNVGKSTLFNALIRSDLCREDAENVVKRATVSAWPGTTLKFLKFPMKRMRGISLCDRISRLKANKLEKNNLNKKKVFSILQTNFNDNLERTQRRSAINVQKEFEDWNVKNFEPSGLDYSDSKYYSSKWFYDTPGVVQRDQITNLLTTSELLLVLPKETLLPRNFTLRPGDSIFVGGLARVDVAEGSNKIWFTVYASMEIPITVTRTENAEEIYKALLGTELFRVPGSGKTRLSKWPSLLPKDFEITGRHSDKASSDLVLSSAGWIAIFLPAAHHSKITAWTPEGRGMYLRNSAIIKTGHLYRGNRIGKTPAYAISIEKRRKVQSFSW